MAIPVRCAECGTTMKVADHYAGKRGKCPKCGGRVQVPKIARTLNVPQPTAAKLPQAKPQAATPILAVPLKPVSLHQSSSISFSSSSIDFRIKKKSALPPPWVWVAGSGSVAIVFLLVVGFFRGGDPQPTASAPDSYAAVPENIFDDSVKETPSTLIEPAPNQLRNLQPLIPVTGTIEPRANRNETISNNFENVAKSIVKFEMPLPDGGMATGTGFLIDRRGWIATNHHVVLMASTAARAKLYSGKKVEIEGIVAIAPERDLAIVKLREIPKDMQPLNISIWAAPKVGTRVYAYGNPLYNEFSLVEGIVSRVLTTTEFADQQPDSVNVLTKLNSPPDSLWIQTDAKVSQGNSGGPLLDEKCRVVGVNTFANLDAQFGFASHIRYLKGLADTATDEVTRLQPPSEINVADRQHLSYDDRSFALNKDILQKVYDAVEAFDWMPATQQQYRKMADLALIMTACKEPGNKDVPFDLSDLVDTIYARMKRVYWSDDQINAINSRAKKSVATGRGIVLVGTVLTSITIKGKSGSTPGLLIRAPGFSELFVITLDENTLTPTQGTRLMILGVTTPKITGATFSKKPDAKVWRIRFLKTHHTIGV